MTNKMRVAMNEATVIGGKYRIEREIKRGGFGVISEGIDLTFGKPVAIKAVDPGLLGEARYIDMFQREAVNVAQLNHQNIVQVLDIKREGANIYIVMELIDGYDLLTLLKACRKTDKPLPQQLAAYLIAEVCNGLHYAHNRRHPDSGNPMNLVHQDISPVNIMVTRGGEIKIIDFGMADFRRQQSETRGQVQIQGNVRYLAPEQIKEDGQVDCRTDIFALGVILFEMLTGERLVSSPNMQEIVEKTLRGDYDLSRLRNDRIAERLQRIADKALQHDPADRYPSANNMYRDLMHYLILSAPAADFMSDLATFLVEMGPVLKEQTESATDQEDMPASIQDTQTELPEVGPADTTPRFEINDFTEAGKEETAAEESAAAAANASVEAEPPGEGVPFSAESTETETASTEPIREPFTTQEAEADSSSNYYSFVEEGNEDDQKTIIDVVRLSARTHRKSMIAVGLALILSSVSFAVVDTFAHMTPVGATIYDFLFPPAIKVVSIPSGASVFLDDKPLPQTTPFALKEVSPGVHKLMLTLPQYQSIVKSISVPSNGEARLSGEAQRRADQPYVLRFKNQFDIVSEPSGANITVDGIDLRQQTPATIYWEVGEKPTTIELELPGLPKLGGLSVDSVVDEEYVADKRLWKISKPVGGRAHYVVEGLFHKSVTLKSRPARADIYYEGSEQPIGITGVNGKLLLKVGHHRFTLRKKGYLANSFAVDVDKQTPAVISKDLPRRVRIFAKDASEDSDKDLKARVVELRLGSRRTPYRVRTPAMVELLPYTYTALLKKPGYENLELKIPAGARTAVAKMKPLYSDITIETIDAITSSPVNTVEISYRNPDGAGGAEILGITNSNGTVVGKLLPGAYEVIVSKNGYRAQQRNIRLRPGMDNRLTFRLTGIR